MTNSTYYAIKNLERSNDPEFLKQRNEHQLKNILYDIFNPKNIKNPGLITSAIRAKKLIDKIKNNGLPSIFQSLNESERC